MKKIYSFLFLIFVCCCLSAQRIQETVYLRNGSVIKGQVIEQEPDGIIKIQTADGSILVYQMSEVERISKNVAQLSQKDGRHRGLDFSVDAGYHIATKGGGGNFSTEIGLGKRFNKNFYWGMGTGVLLPTGGSGVSIPVTTDFKVFFPLESNSLTPGTIFRAGYVANTVSHMNSIMIQIMPSLEIPVSKCVDFNLAAGYTHFIFTKGNGGSGAFSIKTGFGFHKSPVRRPKKPKKPKKPIRDNGVQMTLEGSFLGNEDFGGTGALVVGYKFNPYVNVGIGVGGGMTSSFALNGLKRVDIRDDCSYSGQRSNDFGCDASLVNIFLRGSYRMLNRKWSPVVECDAGIRFYGFGDLYPADYYDEENASFEQIFGYQSSTGLFVSPSVGVSLRTTHNSYLELKVGYTLTSGIPGKMGEAEYTVNN